MSGEEGEIEVYFSHKRVGDGMSEFAQSLFDLVNTDPFPLGNDKPKFRINVDCTNQDHSRDFNIFLGKLLESRTVVFFLNDDYFRSKWCMKEFLSYLDRHDFNSSGYFIACDGWLESQANPILQKNGYDEVKNYWKGELNKLDEEDKDSSIELEILSHRFFKEGYQSFRWLQEFDFDKEENIKGKVHEEGVENIWFSENAKKVWEKLRKIRSRRGDDLITPECSTLQEQAKLRFQNALESSAAEPLSLVNNLRRNAGGNLSVSEYLWGTTLNSAFSTLAASTEEALRVAGAAQCRAIKRLSLDLLSHLFFRAFDDNCDNVFRPDGKSPLDRGVINVKEPHRPIADYIVDSLSGKNSPALHLSEDKSAIEPKGNRQVRQDIKMQSIDSSSEDKANQWGKMIWWVVRRESIEHESLTEEQWKDLAEDLEIDFGYGMARYIVVANDKEGRRDIDDSVWKDLKFKLPYLFIIRLGLHNAPSLLRLNLRENWMRSQLRSFSQLLSKYPD